MRLWVKDWMRVEYMVPSKLMDWVFFANTTGTPKWCATTAAMPMPEASMVRILLMGLSVNSRFHSSAIWENSSMSIWWFKKASTFSTPPAFTTPSRRMRSSNNSTETSLGFGAIFAYRTILGDRALLGNDCRKRP